jgi:hypothetical protein
MTAKPSFSQWDRRGGWGCLRWEDAKLVPKEQNFEVLRVL